MDGIEGSTSVLSIRLQRGCHCHCAKWRSSNHLTWASLRKRLVCLLIQMKPTVAIQYVSFPISKLSLKEAKPIQLKAKSTRPNSLCSYNKLAHFSSSIFFFFFFLFFISSSELEDSRKSYAWWYTNVFMRKRKKERKRGKKKTVDGRTRPADRRRSNSKWSWWV